MKKLLLAIVLLCSFNEAKSEVILNKHGWGLFRRWYNYVEDAGDGLGNHVVDCSKPGFTKCEPSFIVTFPGNSDPLTDASYDAIDQYIGDHVTPTNTSGTFIFNAQYYVIYNYNSDSDLLTTRILSIAEAQNLNYIP